MSTKEMAYNILNQFSEEELKRFVAYFGVIYPIQKQETELTEKQKAFQELSAPHSFRRAYPYRNRRNIRPYQ